MENVKSKPESIFEKTCSESEICIVEPFYGGSHKQLIDLIVGELKLLGLKHDLFTMSAKKWHWRARCSALHFSCAIPKPPHKYKYVYNRAKLESICFQSEFFKVAFS